MVYTVRCFKCGEMAVRLIMGGRSIIHARCHSCEANLLDEVMSFEAEIDKSSHDATTSELKSVRGAAAKTDSDTTHEEETDAQNS